MPLPHVELAGGDPYRVVHDAVENGVGDDATAYAIFLVLLPFLSRGLRLLGLEYHLALAATVLVIWRLTSFISKTLGDSALTGVFGFVYLFILTSAYKWYMKPFTTKQTWLMIGVGLGFFPLYTCASIALSLPVIMVGFGMFLLFDRITFHRRVINRIAQSAFAVYLITDQAISEKLLWGRLFNLQNLYQQPLGNPANPRNPASDLHGLHPAWLHPPGTVRHHHRPTARALVQTTVE